MDIANAKNQGFIARMNHKERVPVQDKKFYDEVKAHLQNLPQAEQAKIGISIPFFKAWTEGWDEANMEYKSVTKN